MAAATVDKTSESIKRPSAVWLCFLLWMVDLRTTRLAIVVFEEFATFDLLELMIMISGVIHNPIR